MTELKDMSNAEFFSTILWLIKHSDNLIDGFSKEQLTNAAARLRAMEWQPIESAPHAAKDEQVWVVGGRYETPRLVFSDGDYWAYESKQGTLKSIPTHWLPVNLPPPPKT